MSLDLLRWYGRLILAQYYQGLEYVAATVAAIILLSSLDDLFIDIWFWTRKFWRKFMIERRYSPLTVEQLNARDEQPIAIMVPAWHEQDVIAAMIENLVHVVDYRAYTIFVGTYQNDAATIREVERMRHRYKHLHRAEVPHDGPTCKADCLNWLVQAILHYEYEAGTEFAGVVMHDSEDVLHPIELKFFNYLLPRKDMIQLPVASLERNWYELVAGTYMDEFAEWHAKDLVVRESLAGAVPSAPAFRAARYSRSSKKPRASRSTPKASPRTTTSAHASSGWACRRSFRSFLWSSLRAARSGSASVRNARSARRCHCACASSFPTPFLSHRVSAVRAGRSASACKAGR